MSSRFAQLKDAEAVQRLLSGAAPDLFKDTAVAFIEMSRADVALKTPEMDHLNLRRNHRCADGHYLVCREAG